MELSKIVAFIDNQLNPMSIDDLAYNGLQVEVCQNVNKVGLAVDSSLDAFQLSRDKNIDLLIVHHGIFWKDSPTIRLTGLAGNRFKFLFRNNLSLYASHLPLDVHPGIGNNVQLARLLNLEPLNWFGKLYNTPVVLEVADKTSILNFDSLVARIQKELTPDPQIYPFGPKITNRIAIATGKATALLNQIAEHGIDTFITGEINHSSYHIAKESGLNIIAAGHYNTETLGLVELGNLIHSNMGVPVEFLDLPTGL